MVWTFHGPAYPSDYDEWFFSPPLQLTAGTVYQVEFYYRSGSEDEFYESMEILWGDDSIASGMTNGPIWPAVVDDITVSVVVTAPPCAANPSPADAAGSVQAYTDLSWSRMTTLHGPVSASLSVPLAVMLQLPN